MFNKHEAAITTDGWTNIEFKMSESDRAEYARLANRVIQAASDNQAVIEALAFNATGGYEQGSVRTGLFGIGGPRNSSDQKIYLHAGFQSEQYAAERIPPHEQPLELKNFWPAHRNMLYEVEAGLSRIIDELGADALQDVILPDDNEARNIHVRTVRLSGALRGEQGAEVVSGHGDLGVLTMHLYETHGGWFKGAPYAPRLITNTDTPEKREDIQNMRRALSPIYSYPGQAVTFLGANWHTLPDEYISDDLKQLPACYHAGFRPDAVHEEVSSYAEEVTAGDPDRVSLIVFSHPDVRLLKSGIYKPATVAMCRPNY